MEIWLGWDGDLVWLEIWFCWSIGWVGHLVGLNWFRNLAVLGWPGDLVGFGYWDGLEI